MAKVYAVGSGGGSTKDIVKVPGGGNLTMQDVFGDPPYNIEFTSEEPADVDYMQKSVYDPTNKAEDLYAYADRLARTKQDKLTGTAGQAVGFDAAGSATAVQGWSNPNLLDNWYFMAPINQRGQTEYIGTGYGIDRWRGLYSNARVVIESDGLTISRILGSTDTSTKNVIQPIENFHRLAGKTVTMSALVSRAVDIAAIILRGATDSVNIASKSGRYSGKPFLLSSTVTLPDDIDGLRFCLRSAGGSDDVTATFAAAKLELGDQQTLAHQDAAGNWVLNDPPNKALELAKCQRHLKAFSKGTAIGLTYCGSDGSIRILCNVPAMRSVPAILSGATITIDGFKAIDSDYLAVYCYKADCNCLELKVDTSVGVFSDIGTVRVVYVKYNSATHLILDANL